MSWGCFIEKGETQKGWYFGFLREICRTVHPPRGPGPKLSSENEMFTRQGLKTFKLQARMFSLYLYWAMIGMLKGQEKTHNNKLFVAENGPFGTPPPEKVCVGPFFAFFPRK